MTQQRDLNADLAICAAATAGPWVDVVGRIDTSAFEKAGYGCPICREFGPTRPEDERFIAEARTGWPDAIKRALAAEAEVERLQRQISDEADWQRELSYRD